MTLQNPNMPAKWHRYEPGVPVRLSSSGLRRNKLAALLGIAILWNVFALFLIATEIADWSQSKNRTLFSPLTFMTVSKGVFAAVGLWYLGRAGKWFLECLNPTTLLNLSGRGAYTGGQLGVGWRINGRARRLKRLTIAFEGRISVSYTPVSSIVTETHVFMRQTVLESDKPEEFVSGQAIIDLSSVVAPTFMAENNKIQWFLCVHGEISRWPDMKDEFEIDIWPSKANKEAK